MSRIYRIVELNIVDFLFGIWAVFFLMSDTVTHISFIDGFFIGVEKIKLKYIIALIVCIYYFVVAFNRGFRFFKKETCLYLFSVGVLTLISLYALVFNSREMDLFNEVLYFLVPIVLSFMYINANEGKVDKAFDIVFVIIVIAFVLKYITKFTPHNFLSIDIIHSFSPFESDLAFILVLLMVYFLWTGKKAKCIISFILCFLSLKRVTLIFSIFCLLFFKKFNTKSQVKKRYYVLFIILFMLVPFVMEFLCSDTMANWFNSTFNSDWNQFVMGRFLRLNVTFDQYRPGGGLGSVGNFTMTYFRDYYNDTKEMFNLHCDNVRFYLECYSVGFLALLFGYIKSAKGYPSLCLMVYIFTESCVNHMFGSGRALYWVVVFLSIFAYNQLVEDKNGEDGDKSEKMQGRDAQESLKGAVD